MSILKNCRIAAQVFAEDVELDIHHRSGFNILEVGVLFGVRNDTNGYVAFVALYVGLTNGQTDAVDGN